MNNTDMCAPCQARACGSCLEEECDCFGVFQAWANYHAATIRPIGLKRDAWDGATAEVPPHHAFTGRHERNLGYRIDGRGRRFKTT